MTSNSEKQNTVWILWSVDCDYGGGVCIEEIFSHKPSTNDIKDALSDYKKYLKKKDCSKIAGNVDGIKVKTLVMTQHFYLEEIPVKGNGQ